MPKQIRLENIEALRRKMGIEDEELSEQIQSLAVGDLVLLTFLTEVRSPTAETLPVRITSLRGGTYRGKLVAGPASKALPELKAGLLLTFVAGHIHSIPKEHAARKHSEEIDNRGRLTRAASTTNATTRK